MMTYFIQKLSLKELRNYKRKFFFVSATKINENTTNMLKWLFFAINLHFVISSQIFTYGKLNLPLTSSICFVCLPLEMQKRLKQTEEYDAIYKPLKVAAAKTLFSSVYFIGTTCDVTLRFFLTAMLLLSLKPVFWKKLCVISTIAIWLIPKFQNKA